PSGTFSAPHFFSGDDTATTAIYTLSLHDALPIFRGGREGAGEGRGLGRLRRRLARPRRGAAPAGAVGQGRGHPQGRAQSVAVQPDRKSTRLNSSHVKISYAVFCLKKKNKNKPRLR